MKELFVPHEQSLELRKLEFSEPCLGFYVGKDKEVFMSSYDFNAPYQFRLDSKTTFVAPTFTQAFRWFRKNYDLHSNVGLYNFHENTYCFNVVTKTIPHYLDKVTHFHSHEEAELECLKKLIELVKNK